MPPFIIPSAEIYPELFDMGAKQPVHKDAPVPAGVDYDARHAATAAVIAGLSYKSNGAKFNRNASRFGTSFCTFDSKHERAILIANGKDIWVAFAGSNLNTFDHYLHNINHTRRAHPIGGAVHSGFMRRLDSPVTHSSIENLPSNQALMHAVHERIVMLHALYPNARIHFTGHSSGGASAVLQAAYFAQQDMMLALSSVADITTFGQPRVGNSAFYNAFHQYYGGKYQRFLLPHDYITSLPPSYHLGPLQLYIHGGIEHQLAMPSSVSDVFTIAESAVTPSSALQPVTRAHAKSSFTDGLVDMVRKNHGVGVYLDACLTPLGLHASQFLRQLLGNGKIIDIGSAFNDMARDYIAHTLDLLTHYRPAIQHTADAAIYDARMAEMKALHSAWGKGADHDIVTFGAVAAELAPIAAKNATEDNALSELHAFMGWVATESQRHAPVQAHITQFLRGLDGIAASPVSEKDKADIAQKCDELRQHLASKTTMQHNTSNSSQERVCFLVRRIAETLEPYMAKHPAFATLLLHAEWLQHHGQLEPTAKLGRSYA